MEEISEKKQFKRAPAIYRTIDTINEKDIRVRLLGRVIGKSEGVLVLDDGTGRADIVIDDADVSERDLVRVFARVLPLENGYELRAELIQKMDGIDEELYKKIVFKNN